MCINLEVLTGQYILHFYEWTGIEWQQILIFSLMFVTYRLMVRCWPSLHVFYGRSNLHSNNVVSSISANDIGFRFKRYILNCYCLVLFVTLLLIIVVHIPQLLIVPVSHLFIGLLKPILRYTRISVSETSVFHPYV